MTEPATRTAVIELHKRLWTPELLSAITGLNNIL